MGKIVPPDKPLPAAKWHCTDLDVMISTNFAFYARKQLLLSAVSIMERINNDDMKEDDTVRDKPFPASIYTNLAKLDDDKSTEHGTFFLINV